MSSILFPTWIEAFVTNMFTMIVTISIISYFILLTLLFTRTPKEMSSYRLTMTWTTFWNAALILHGCIMFRIVPMFPLPMAKVTGPLSYLGSYYGGYIGFLIFVFLLANMIVAILICFLSMFICVAHPLAYRTLSVWKHGIPIYAISHLLMTIIVVPSAVQAYTPVEDIRRYAAQAYPYLYDFIYDPNLVIFGFNPNVSKSFFYMMATIFAATSVTIFAFLTLGLLAINKVRKANNYSFWRNVGFMMVARNSPPVIFGLLPTSAAFALAWAYPEESYVYGNMLLVISFSTGFIMNIVPMIIFTPFRTALISPMQFMKDNFSSSNNQVRSKSSGR